MVSSSFYPELSPRSFRATELAKEFSRQGHRVKVLTKYRQFDYQDFLKLHTVNLEFWNRPLSGNIRPNRFPRLSRVINRLLGIIFEYPAIKEMFWVKKMLRTESGYDLVISFAVPHPVHWGVAWVRNSINPIGKVWVADCGDPYMFARLDRFRKPFYFKYPEMKFCRKCDFLSVPFQEMRNQFYPEFKPKIMVIPQGFNFDEIKVHRGKPRNESPVFVFAGSVIPGKRDLKLLLDFLCTINRNFQFIIYSNQPDWFGNYKEKLGEKISIRKYVDRKVLIYEMSKADFLINVDTTYDNKANVEAVPSKLIDYALADRPILNINSSQLDETKVMEFLNGDYSKQRRIDKSNFDIRRITSRFLELCSSTTQTTA